MKNNIKFIDQLSIKRYDLDKMLKKGQGMAGHLLIREFDKSYPLGRVVFDQSNVITLEGKGNVMDWMASKGMPGNPTFYPLGGMFLSTNGAAETDADTYASAVAGQISNDGVLHMFDGGEGVQVSTTHVQGSLQITLDGTIDAGHGNDPPNSISSVNLVSGAADGSGYGSTYVPTGNETLWARVAIGTLTKTSSNFYSFSWTILLKS